jgi:hypothetical protein
LIPCASLAKNRDPERSSRFAKEIQNDLRIAFGAKTVPSGLEISSQFSVVVDLAVKDDGELADGIGHRLKRLVPQIDNGQSAMSQRHTSVAGKPLPAAIRSANGHCVPHHGNLSGRWPLRFRAVLEYTCDAAHKFSFDRILFYDG